MASSRHTNLPKCDSVQHTKFTDIWGFFTPMPEVVLEMMPEIGTDAVVMFLFLSYRTNRERGVAWPSYEHMQEWFKNTRGQSWSRQRISAAIKQLETHAGVLTKGRRFNSSNLYRLHPPIENNAQEAIDSPGGGQAASDIGTTDEMDTVGASPAVDAGPLEATQVPRRNFCRSESEPDLFPAGTLSETDLSKTELLETDNTIAPLAAAQVNTNSDYVTEAVCMEAEEELEGNRAAKKDLRLLPTGEYKDMCMQIFADRNKSRFSSRREKTAWMKIVRLLQTGKVSKDWVEHMHSAGIRPQSHSVHWPRWNFMQFCEYVCNDERAREWEISQAQKRPLRGRFWLPTTLEDIEAKYG